MTQQVYTDLEVKPHFSEMTFGQKLVGLTFNPSGDPKVQRVKELCAELADILQVDYIGRTLPANKVMPELYPTLHSHAVGEILNAQMNVVKVLTLQ